MGKIHFRNINSQEDLALDFMSDVLPVTATEPPRLSGAQLAQVTGVDFYFEGHILTSGCVALATSRLLQRDFQESPPPPSSSSLLLLPSPPPSSLLVQVTLLFLALWTGTMTDVFPQDSVPQPVPGAEKELQESTESRAEDFKMDQEMKIERVEDRGLLESSMRLKPHEAQNYRKKALWVSWASIVVTMVLAVAAFTVSVMRHSASAFGFAFDATLDVLSSVIVLWRYSNAAAVHSAHREYIACVTLGVIFVLSSLCIMGKAVHDLATELLPQVDDFLFSVSIVSGLTCLILAAIKVVLGRVLTSRALFTDGFNSLVGGVMGFSILISAEVFKHEPKVWYLDGTIGVLMGLIILAYGVKLLLDMVPRVRQTRNYERFE